MAVRDYQFIVGPETSTLPSATDPSASGDIVTLGYANSHYTRGVAAVSDVKAIAAADRNDNQTLWVDSLKAFFYFDSASSEAGNDVSVITPTAGSGRWVRVKQPKTDVATTATINALASNTQFVKFTGSTTTALNGIANGSDGYRILLVNASSANVVLANESGSATASDRIITQNGGDLTLTPNKSVELAYDSTSSRWRVVGGGSGGGDISVTSKTANYTATVSDYLILCNASGGGFTISLPTASGNTGKVFIVKKTDSALNGVVVDGNSSETIDGELTYTLGTQFESVQIVSDGTNWQVIG